MATFYRLTFPEEWEHGEPLCLAVELLHPRINLFTAGKIEQWPDDATIRIACGEVPRFDPWVLSTPEGDLCVTARLAEVLDAGKIEGCQLLRVTPVGPYSELAQGMYLAHVVHCVAALDMGRSKFAYYLGKARSRQGEITRVIQPVVSAPLLPEGLDMFRLFNERVGNCGIYVSERFKSVCETAGVESWAFEVPTLSGATIQ
jgi:hypothetical protein